MEKIRKLRLFQKQDYISLDYTRQDVSVFSLSRPAAAGSPQIINRKLTPARKEPLEEELRSFVNAIQNGGRVECTGTEGRQALGLALQILAQAEKAQAREIDSK